MYPLKEKGNQLSSLEGYGGPHKGSQAGQAWWHREGGGMGRMPREQRAQRNGEEGDLCSSINGSGQGHRSFVWIKQKGTCREQTTKLHVSGQELWS